MSKPVLTEAQRMAVDALKSDASVFVNCPSGQSGKTFVAAVAVAEMAEELGGIWIRDARTGTDYFVPPGTPWEEALPVRDSSA